MAMVCKKYSCADFVISTGTNLETLRFRSGLASMLGVPVSSVEGWVLGEHGSDAVFLWSTVKIKGQNIGEYLKLSNKSLEKNLIDIYVKSVSKLIIANIGGTEYGPAASFRDIVRAIVTNCNELLPVATPLKFGGISEPVFVSVPIQLGNSVRNSIFETLSSEEKNEIRIAAEAIYKTFLTAINC